LVFRSSSITMMHGPINIRAITDTLHEDLDAIGCADSVLRSKNISNERWNTLYVRYHVPSG